MVVVAVLLTEAAGSTLSHLCSSWWCYYKALNQYACRLCCVNNKPGMRVQTRHAPAVREHESLHSGIGERERERERERDEDGERERERERVEWGWREKERERERERERR